MWMKYIPSKVFTEVKTNFSDDIKSDYNMTDSNFSTQATNVTDAKFPFVRMKTVRASEIGNDLENKTSNAGDFEFWFYISDNRTENRALTVAYEVKRILKTMSFNVSDLVPTDNLDVKEVLLKCSRVIGSGDSL